MTVGSWWGCRAGDCCALLARFDGVDWVRSGSESGASSRGSCFMSSCLYDMMDEVGALWDTKLLVRLNFYTCFESSFG